MLAPPPPNLDHPKNRGQYGNYESGSIIKTNFIFQTLNKTINLLRKHQLNQMLLKIYNHMNSKQLTILIIKNCKRQESIID